MARLARGEVFDPLEVSAWYCINRCVRRCFLCGHDPVSGNNLRSSQAVGGVALLTGLIPAGRATASESAEKQCCPARRRGMGLTTSIDLRPCSARRRILLSLLASKQWHERHESSEHDSRRRSDDGHRRALPWGLCLCPLRKSESGQPDEPTDEELRSITRVAARLLEIRQQRLSDMTPISR
jgi:hypothetical protein